MARRADPDRILSHLSRRRERPDEYRIYHGDLPTSFLVARNGNEPAHSPMAWGLVWSPIDPREGAVRHMDAEAGTIRELLRAVAKHLANICTIDFR